MAGSLEQNEVDALLAAVDSGTIPPRGTSAPTDTSRRKGGGAGYGANVEYQLYDFKRPERVSKDQMRSLEALHEGFGRNFGASLSGFLRTIVEVNVAHLEQLTYSEFIHSLPNPTCFNLLTSDQLDGQICLEISPLIIYPIIDRLLGGSNADLFIPQRPLTQIEQRLVDQASPNARRRISSEAWSAVNAGDVCRERITRSNPQLVQIVPPNETVVVVGFEVKMGNRTGTMSLCVPYTSIEPLMQQLTAQTWFNYQKKGSNDVSQRRLNQNLASAPVELRTILARTTLRMSDLLSLQVGDIITTDKSHDDAVTIEIEGRPKFHGAVGQFRGGKAVRITRLTRGAMPTEPVESGRAKAPSRRQA